MQTFMTIAYKFFQHAESSGWGYRAPVKRMMHLLQLFDQDLMDAYDQGNNTADADSARATLLVAAVSYAFKSDLRSEFEALSFPVDNEFYESLVSRAGDVNTVPVLARLIPDVSLAGCSEEYGLSLADSVVFFDPDGDALTYEATSSEPGVAVASTEGTTLRVARVSAGKAKITVTATDVSGGAESTAFIVTVDACDCACSCHADPQCDGVTTVHDVVRTVDVAFRGSAPIPDQNAQCPRQTTDVNCDGVTTVHDVVRMVNVAFRGVNPATEFCNPCP
jgi:hypothetical protein